MKHIITILLVGCSSLAWAGSENNNPAKNERTFWGRWWDNVTSTWDNNRVEGVVPVNTWHNRWVYEHSKVHDYNERPWGIGGAKYRLDADGDRHRLMAIVFQDSHNKPEPAFGYTWQHLFRKDKDFRPSLGFIAGITFRDDYNWLPIPAVLPIVGFDIGNFSFENTYIPGLGGNNGNVLFSWITWRF